MVDTAQFVLLFVVVALTILLICLGVQVYFILRELRRTVEKANKVLDETGMITESISGPLASLSTLASGIKTGAMVANFLKGKGSKRRKEEDDDRS